MAKKTKARPILVPVDFSAHSEAAFIFAAELATRLKAPLIIAHVVHDPGENPGFYSSKKGKKQMHRHEDIAEEMMEEFVARINETIPQHPVIKGTRTIVVTGIPVSRILLLVKKEEPQMVVMGSRGRTGLAQIMIGSKAEQVMRLCPVPVTIVKQPAQKPA